MNITDEILDESDVAVEDRATLAVAANRFVNMVGGRYSDALRDQAALYVRLGRDGYLRRETELRESVRALGY